MNSLNMLLFAGAKMNEKDLKILIALLIIVLIVILIFGFLQKLVAKIMDYQGRAIDEMMFNIIKTGVIKDTDKKTFRRVAGRKSRVLLLKQAWLPFTLLAVTGLALIIFAASTSDWQFKFLKENCYAMHLGLSFPTSKFFGLTLISDWPHVSHAPDFSPSFAKYFVFVDLLFATVFLIWYLVVIQAYLARTLRIFQLLRLRFGKDLTKQGGIVNGEKRTSDDTVSNVQPNMSQQ